MTKKPKEQDDTGTRVSGDDHGDKFLQTTQGVTIIRDGVRIPVDDLTDPEPVAVIDILARLLSCGFTRIGAWRVGTSGMAHLDGQAPAEPGVYAFFVGGRLCYVGAAQRGLHHRMQSYSRNQRIGGSRRPIHRELALVLKNAQAIDVLAVIPEQLNWRGLPVDTIAGLEEGLIRLFQPPWNRRGLGVAKDKVAVVLAPASLEFAEPRS